MKRLFILTCLCSMMSLTVFAQEEKKESAQAASPEISALQIAANLACYGYDNYSPTALIEAARIFIDTQVQDLGVEKTMDGDGKQQEKDSNISFDPAKLLADAREFAGKDKTLLALADKVEKDLKSSATRGAVGGPRYSEDIVYAHSTATYQLKFWANELAEVAVIGDGDNDLDLYIYDQNGNLIEKDDDYTDQCICRWIPVWTGTFTIKIVNRGNVYSYYAIATN